jgi:hypothetical protein
LPQLHRLFNLRRNQRRQTRLVKIEWWKKVNSSIIFSYLYCRGLDGSKLYLNNTM